MIVNPQITLPAPTPANPTPTPVVVNPTPSVVAPNPSPVTVGGVTPAGGNAIANAVDAKADVHLQPPDQDPWTKSTTSGHMRYWGKSARGEMVNGRLQATADMRGYTAPTVD